ncbi:MAG: Uma2 family endonuclease [Isosphaeraceae bacterium]
MARVILPFSNLKQLVRERRATGADRYDEVWEGVYVLSPEADNDHQRLVFRLARAIDQALGDRPDVQILPGTNISDRPTRWRRNYRCPDVAVFMPGNPAEDKGSHWLGGPDLAVEILSPQDRSRQKLEFYAAVETREVLLVDREPWKLELYKNEGGRPTLCGSCEPGSGSVESLALGLTFRIVDASPRPLIQVTAHGGGPWNA